MDGSSRAFGVGGEIELCGKKYMVHAKTVECYSEVEAYIRQQRGDPASMLAGRAREFSQLNTRTLFEQIQELLKEKSKREQWPEQSLHHANALLADAVHECDTSKMYEDIMSKAFDEAKNWSIVTLWEVHEFLELTWQGQCMKLWFAIRDNDPQTLTLTYVTNLFYNELMQRTREGGEDAAVALRQEIDKAIAIAEGTDAMGNSTGSPQTSSVPEATNKTQMAPKSESTGT